MNFLGHLYFSDNNPELMYANLYGDTVKGTVLENYPPIIQSGIFLHRSIDHYIDHHPKVVALMRELYSELPKVTGIAIDLFFDYLLASNWNKYHNENYDDFVNRFYAYQPVYWDAFSDDFKEFIGHLRSHRWISYYREFEGLRHACKGVSSRISFKNQLGEAPEVFIKNEKIIRSCFEEYMSEAIPHFQQLYTTLEY